MTLLSNALAKRIVVPIDKLIHGWLEPIIILREAHSGVGKLPIEGVVQEEIAPKGIPVRNPLYNLGRERAIPRFGIKPSLWFSGGARAREQAVQPVRDADVPAAVVRHINDEVRCIMFLEVYDAVLEYLEPFFEGHSCGEASHRKNSDVAVKVEVCCAEADHWWRGSETRRKSDICQGCDVDEGCDGLLAVFRWDRWRKAWRRVDEGDVSIAIGGTKVGFWGEVSEVVYTVGIRFREAISSPERGAVSEHSGRRAEARDIRDSDGLWGGGSNGDDR